MPVFGLHVERSIFEDRKRLDPNFDTNGYHVISRPSTSSKILKAFKTYYSKNLPVALPVWSKLFATGDEDEIFDYKLDFVQDELNVLFHEQESEAHPANIIGFHPPKNKYYPIFRMDIEKYHLTLVISNLSGKWYVSVKSDISLHCSIADYLFDEDEGIDARTAPFPEEYCFGAFSEDPNRKNFSFVLKSDCDLYAFCLILKKFLSKEVYE